MTTAEATCPSTGVYCPNLEILNSLSNVAVLSSANIVDEKIDSTELGEELDATISGLINGEAKECPAGNCKIVANLVAEFVIDKAADRVASRHPFGLPKKRKIRGKNGR